jgi:hypothetical protein
VRSDGASWGVGPSTCSAGWREASPAHSPRQPTDLASPQTSPAHRPRQATWVGQIAGEPCRPVSWPVSWPTRCELNFALRIAPALSQALRRKSLRRRYLWRRLTPLACQRGLGSVKRFSPFAAASRWRTTKPGGPATRAARLFPDVPVGRRLAAQAGERPRQPTDLAGPQTSPTHLGRPNRGEPCRPVS